MNTTTTINAVHVVEYVWSTACIRKLARILFVSLMVDLQPPAMCRKPGMFSWYKKEQLPPLVFTPSPFPRVSLLFI